VLRSGPQIQRATPQSDRKEASGRSDGHECDRCATDRRCRRGLGRCAAHDADGAGVLQSGRCWRSYRPPARTRVLAAVEKAPAIEIAAIKECLKFPTRHPTFARRNLIAIDVAMPQDRSHLQRSLYGSFSSTTAAICRLSSCFPCNLQARDAGARRDASVAPVSADRDKTRSSGERSRPACCAHSHHEWPDVLIAAERQSASAFPVFLIVA
jgi:hypothetical protein